MRSIDTNVIARWLLRDDVEQASMADRIMGEPVELTGSVALELGWLLMSVGRMTRDQFADAMSSILAINTLYTANKAALNWAIDRFRAGADWGDVVHIALTREAGSFVTFDRALRKRAGSSSPVIVEVL